VEREGVLRDAPALRALESSRFHCHTNVQLLQTRKYVFAREQLIQPPPKTETLSKERFSVATQDSDVLQMWKVWAEQQRTLVPPIISLNDRADGQRFEWPPCYHRFCENLDGAVNNKMWVFPGGLAVPWNPSASSQVSWNLWIGDAAAVTTA